ncbi:MAG: recombinase family protein [Candidatus Saccharimonas sp.]
MILEKAVSIARVSSKRQEDEGYSLPAQKKLLQTYAIDRGLKVQKTFEIAESASKTQQRKIFQAAMRYIEENGVKHLLVEKVDRHVRNLHDAVETHDWLTADKERKVHFVKDSLVMHQNSRSQEWLNWGIRVVMAKNYIDNLREESMKGTNEKLAQGWSPTTPPLGYHTILKDGKRIHEPDPHTWRVIKEMFELFLREGESAVTVTKEMAKRGIVTRGGRPYQHSKVVKMLGSKYYIGIIEFSGKEYPGNQETFISKDLFERVQNKLHGNRPSVYKRHNPLFKNMITCGLCGGVVTWQLQKGRYYGACQRLSEACKGRKTIREDRLEEDIKRMLKNLVSPKPEVVDWAMNELKARDESSSLSAKESIKDVESQIERFARMDSRLYDDKLAGDISREVYQSKHDTFIEQISALEAEKDRLERALDSKTEKIIVFTKLSQKAAELYDTRSINQKRVIITKLFQNITFEQGFVSVKYKELAQVIANKSLKTREILGS